METYFQRRAREDKEHTQLLHTIVTEFLNSKFLIDYYREELKDAEKEQVEGDKTMSGIGEGRYFKTLRFYIEETFDELLGSPFETIRECEQLHRHIHDTVTTKLRDEVDFLGDLEDHVTYRFGDFIGVEVSLDDIFDELKQEFRKTLTEEECEQFAKDNAPSIKATT